MPAPRPDPATSAALLPVRPGVGIPRHEITFRATRSGGPGGQHVNKTASRVELTWHPASSVAFSDAARARVVTQLAHRLDGQGVLRVVSDRTRSQLQNREDAESRLAELVRRALVVPKARKATRPSRAAKARRVEAKRRHSAKKADRRRRGDD